jgi:prepilin signal peptidase PulO-like enzyme (type II secretory pathway)
MIIFSPLAFVFGTCVGSFLNVIILRFPKGEPIIKKRSYCPSCKKTLAWYDLIPLLSFVILKARCRYCGKKISWQYPLVEGATGLLFLFSYLVWLQSGSTLLLLPYLLFLFFASSILFLIFVFDLKYGIIPDKIILWAIFGWAIYQIITILVRLSSLWLNLRASELGQYMLTPPYFASQFRLWFQDILWALVAGLFVAVFFYLLVIVTKGRGMGLGDVKFGFWLGLLVSTPKIFGLLFIAFFSGAFVSLILILLGRKKLRETVPFGPFLSFAAILVLFLGDFLTSFYLANF